MRQRKPEHRLLVESDDGRQEEVISYGVYRMTSRNMRERPRQVRERLAEIGMEDGRVVFVPDEEHVIIDGTKYQIVDKRPYDEEGFS